jgi:hypothetical protein
MEPRDRRQHEGGEDGQRERPPIAVWLMRDGEHRHDDHEAKEDGRALSCSDRQT